MYLMVDISESFLKGERSISLGGQMVQKDRIFMRNYSGRGLRYEKFYQPR